MAKRPDRNNPQEGRLILTSWNSLSPVAEKGGQGHLNSCVQQELVALPLTGKQRGAETGARVETSKSTRLHNPPKLHHKLGTRAQVGDISYSNYKAAQLGKTSVLNWKFETFPTGLFCSFFSLVP